MTDLPDEDTIRVRRSAGGVLRGVPAADREPDAAPVSGAGAAERADPQDGADPAGAADPPSSLTEPIDPLSADAHSDEIHPVRHRATYVDPESEIEQTDGSTIVARRESRRRAAREHAAMQPRVPPLPRPPHDAPAAPVRPGRAASAPGVAATDAVYGARTADPVFASRTAPPLHAPQTPADGTATARRHRQRARRTALIVVVSASAVGVAAAASLVALALMP
ncbi:hypothetical protein [Microbacterium terregens]|uniref:Uncharacterized protein n=1 Tax=Microbacterium terregens TaxID=69363 RepID=A0ABV5SZ38_9MICO